MLETFKMDRTSSLSNFFWNCKWSVAKNVITLRHPYVVSRTPFLGPRAYGAREASFFCRDCINELKHAPGSVFAAKFGATENFTKKYGWGNLDMPIYICFKNQFFRENVVVMGFSELRPGSNENSTFYGSFRFLIFSLIFNKKQFCKSV